MNLRSTLTTATFALCGVALMCVAGGRLQAKKQLDFKPNPLGLKASPYGQIIAMAIQAPIDEDWHGGIEIHSMPASEAGPADETCQHEGCDHDHAVCGHDHGTEEHDHSNCTHGHEAPAEPQLAEHDESCKHGNCSHGHEEPAEPLVAEHDEGSCSDPGCEHDHADTPPTDLIGRLTHAVSKRTNPNPPTEGHRLYLRHEIEKKMRFAYDLDPSHYGNYNIYHLFLTQDQLGTSEHTADRTRSHAVKLAESTIRYCLREAHDPRPALTAASAAYNILEAMFINSEIHTTKSMRQQLTVMDFCLRRHFELLEESSNSGTWNLLSEARQAEVLQRSRFTLKLREAADKTILRLETKEQSTVTLDPS